MQLRRAHDINRHTKKFDFFSRFLCRLFFCFIQLSYDVYISVTCNYYYFGINRSVELIENFYKAVKIGLGSLSQRLDTNWTRKKERRRLCGEKDDGDGSARQKEKRKAKEKVDGFGERRHGKGWS